MADRAVLFDIDATLLLTEGAGLRAMKTATRALFGERFGWDGMETSGGLDPMLFREAARRSRLEVTDQDHDAFRERYLEALPAELERSGPRVRAMPGVHEVLDLLRRRADVLIGILTGNYPVAAAMKLRSVAIDPAWFRVRVHGDEGTTRPALGKVALAKLGAATNAAFPPRRVLLVGDTPHDIACARENGFICLAVATGRFGVEALRAAGAEHVARDLADPAALLRLIARAGDGER